MDCPSSANELCQFIHCCKWTSSCIPNVHSISQPLSDILEETYAFYSKRRTASLEKVAFHKLSWGAIHEAAVTNLKEILNSAVKLAHLKEVHVISLFMNASDTFWAGNVTQVQQLEMRMEVEKQQHQSLPFLEGRFSRAEEYWTTYEKEAFAVVNDFEKIDYVLWGPNPVRIYSNH